MVVDNNATQKQGYGGVAFCTLRPLRLFERVDSNELTPLDNRGI
jgi:hypothetical protein